MDSEDLTGLAVALGRIEERLNSMSTTESRTDERLSRVESGLTEVRQELNTWNATQKPKAPWYVVVGGISGIGSLLLTAGAVWFFLFRVTDALHTTGLGG